MSGPKVLRIVTREEILEICRGQIAQVEGALREWERVGSRNQVIGEADRAKLASQVEHIRSLLAKDQFVEVQKRAPILVDSIRRDMSQRVEELYSAEAVARRRDKSLRASTKQLHDQLRKANVSIPKNLEGRLLAASEGRTFPADELQQVVADALRLLPDPETTQINEEQRDLIRQLTGSDCSRNLDDWIASSQPAASAQVLKTLDRYLGQLAACQELDKLSEFTARAELLTAEPNETRRQMLLDSLCLEVAAAVRHGQRFIQLKQAAADELATVVAAGDMEVCREAVQSLEKCLATRDVESAQECLNRVKQIRAAATQLRSAQASRASLLKGLKELGYTVNEGMTTAWTQNKQLVIRHPTMSGVALELGGIGQNNQFQARVVAVQGEDRDARNDKQVETAWCDELSKIQTRFVAWGSELKVERAIPAGVQALKVVVSERSRDDDENTQPRARTLS